jgi:hypothetical protein
VFDGLYFDGGNEGKDFQFGGSFIVDMSHGSPFLCWYVAGDVWRFTGARLTMADIQQRE